MRRAASGQSAALAVVLVSICVVAVLPFFAMAYYAFTDISFSIPGRNGEYAGWSNFDRVTSDSRFGESLVTTIQFAAVAVPVELVCGLILALILPRSCTLTRIALSLISLPLFLSGISVGLLWRLLLHGDYGVALYLVRRLGLLGMDTSVLGSPTGAFLALLLADSWQWIPFCTVVLYAGRLALPNEPYIAASLDGANSWRSMLDITLPGLTPYLAVCFLFRTMDAIREFDKIIVLTNGGPGSHTELLSLYLWNVSYVQGDLAYGSALSLVIYLAVLVLASALIALNRGVYR